jgi:4-hydroxy-tetrahydrodipicolinate synthase
MPRRFPNDLPFGVIPAALMAFHDDFSMDEPSARKHLRDLAAVKGVQSLTVNGHASEVHACTFEEQERILSFSLEEVGDRLPLVNGVYADGSLEAARIARMSAKAGAAALLVFPPQCLAMGGQLRPEMALSHFKTIADAADLPLILFQYPLKSGLGYPWETLLALVEQVPSIRAIKDWCNDPLLHERQTRVLQARPRPVNMLTTHSAWLLGSLVFGARGLLSGAGSVVADLQAALFAAVQAGDLPRAQGLHRRYHAIAELLYADPFLDMHNRMKTCLVLLGRLPSPVVRPPFQPLPAAEVERLREGLARAGVGPEGARGI